MRKFDLSPVLASAIALLAPALLSLCFTFGAADYCRGLVWDSSHYVLSSQSLLNWLGGCLHHHYVSPAKIDLGPSLMVDGPVLPCFGAVLVSLGQLVHLSAEQSILIGQSFVCGLNSLLLFWLALRLVDRRLALAGALLFGFYPATLVSASQFLTEQLTTTALLCFTLVLCLALPRGRLDNPNPTKPLQYGAWLVLGILTLLILHLKTALFPTAFLILLLALTSGSGSFKSKGKILLFAALGFFICVTPWLVFSKLASGRIYLAPNRVPSINLAVGMDLESDGWGVVPPTDSVMPIIFDKPSAIAASLWLANPAGMTSLFLRKAERLFAYSWNDFCWPVFGLTIEAQCFLQRLVLAGALLGAIFLLTRERLLSNSLTTLNNLSFLKLTVLLVVAGHLIFIPFETQPRYGYSALPFLILLTLLAADHLIKNRRPPIVYTLSALALILLASQDMNGVLYAATASLESVLGLKTVVASLLFALLMAAGSGLANGPDFKKSMAVALPAGLLTYVFLVLKSANLPPPQWACTIPPGAKAQREIVLPANIDEQWRDNRKNLACWAAILIDSDKNIDDTLITINQEVVKKNQDKTIPLLDIEQSYAFQKTVQELVALAAKTRGEETAKLKQWRLVQVPLSYVHNGGESNVIAVYPDRSNLTLYGQYRFKDNRDRQLWLPSLYGFSALRLSILGDSRTTDTLKRRFGESDCLFYSHFLPEWKNLDLSFAVQERPAGMSQPSRDLSPDQPGTQTGDYRIYLVLACKNQAKTSLPPTNSKPVAEVDLVKSKVEEKLAPSPGSLSPNANRAELLTSSDGQLISPVPHPAISPVPHPAISPVPHPAGLWVNKPAPPPEVLERMSFKDYFVQIF